MPYALGRPYPSDVTNTIRNLGEAIDGLMAGSIEYEMLTDSSVASTVSALNAQLVNNVIIQSDKISDEEARNRLWEIQKEIFTIQGDYNRAGVDISGYPSVATVEDIAHIPMADAEQLLARFQQAYALYPSVVDRYGTVRGALSVASGVPFAGPAFTALLATYDNTVSNLDDQVFFARDASEALAALVSEGGDSVQIARPTYDRIRNWTSGVFQMDEVLKRFEAEATEKPAEPLPPTKKPWGLYIIGGLVLLGGAYLLFGADRK